MPKPFPTSSFIRNFTGSGVKAGQYGTPYDRRVDWVPNIPPPPPPPPPTISVLSRPGTLEYQGEGITIDQSTQALINGDVGNFSMSGLRAIVTADAAKTASLENINLTMTAYSCNGTYIPAWVPNDPVDKSLVLWLDAQDKSTLIDRGTGLPVITGNYNIQAWNDKSFYGHDMTSVGSSADPGWTDSAAVPDAIGTYGTVVFNGVDEYLRNASPNAAVTNRYQWTIFAVLKEGGGGDYYSSRTASGDRTIRVGAFFGTSETCAVYDGTTYVGGSIGDVDGPHFFVGVIKLFGASSFRVSHGNNDYTFTSSPQSDPGSESADSFIVGARYSIPGYVPESWYDGGLGELLVFNTLLDDDKGLNVLNYLKRRWPIDMDWTEF